MSGFLWVGAGGFLGALARYGVSVAIIRHAGGSPPWPTLMVNLVGCLVIGILLGRAEEHWLENESQRLFWWIGFLGSFTTFSTFSLETLQICRQGALVAAAAYALTSLAGTLMAAAGGFGLGRWLAR